MAEGEARAGGEAGGGGEEAETGAGDDRDIYIGATSAVQEERGWLGSVTQYDLAQYCSTFTRPQVDMPLEAYSRCITIAPLSRFDIAIPIAISLKAYSH